MVLRAMRHLPQQLCSDTLCFVHHLLRLHQLLQRAWGPAASWRKPTHPEQLNIVYCTALHNFKTKTASIHRSTAVHFQGYTCRISVVFQHETCLLFALTNCTLHQSFTWKSACHYARKHGLQFCKAAVLPQLPSLPNS